MKRLHFILALFAAVSCRALVTNPVAWSLVLDTNGVVTAPSSFWTNNRVMIATNITVQGGSSNYWNATTMTLTISTNAENSLPIAGGTVIGNVTISTGNVSVLQGSITLGNGSVAVTNQWIDLNTARIIFDATRGLTPETSMYGDANGVAIRMAGGSFLITNIAGGVSWALGQDGIFRLNGSNFLDQLKTASASWNQTATGAVNMARYAVSNAASVALTNGAAFAASSIGRAGTFGIYGRPLDVTYALSNTPYGLIVTGAGSSVYNGTYTNSGSLYDGRDLLTNSASGTIAFTTAGAVFLSSNTASVGYFALGTNFATEWTVGDATGPAPGSFYGGLTTFDLVPTNPPTSGYVLTASTDGRTRWAASSGGGGGTAVSPTNVFMPFWLGPVRNATNANMGGVRGYLDTDTATNDIAPFFFVTTTSNTVQDGYAKAMMRWPVSQATSVEARVWHQGRTNFPLTIRFADGTNAMETALQPAGTVGALVAVQIATGGTFLTNLVADQMVQLRIIAAHATTNAANPEGRGIVEGLWVRK